MNDIILKKLSESETKKLSYKNRPYFNKFNFSNNAWFLTEVTIWNFNKGVEPSR